MTADELRGIARYTSSLCGLVKNTAAEEHIYNALRGVHNRAVEDTATACEKIAENIVVSQGDPCE